MSKVKQKIPPSFELNEPASTYGSFSSNALNSWAAISKAREGVSMQYLTNLSNQLAISFQELGGILHISLRTLQRYTPAKKLDTDASAKALQLASLHQHGLLVFGNADHFNEWLRSPIPALGGQRPLDLLDTPYGFQLVDQTLGRIEHGIFA